MEVSQLYSVLYFVMLLMLGIGSMLGNTAAILTPLTDSKFIASRFPKEVISGKCPPHSRRGRVCKSFGVLQLLRVPQFLRGVGNSKYTARRKYLHTPKYCMFSLTV